MTTGLNVDTIRSNHMAKGKAPRAYEKHAWTLLFIFWAQHLVLSVRDSFPSLQDFCIGCLPCAQTAIQSSTGMSWSQLASAYPESSQCSHLSSRRWLHFRRRPNNLLDDRFPNEFQKGRKMGLVRILVDANWNFRCSGQRVSVDWLRDG